MKKRTIPVLAGLILLLALRVFAAGGTESDPLLSVSYLMEVLFPQMETTIAQRVEEQTAAIRAEALERVEEIGSAAAEQEQEGPFWSYSGLYKTLDLKRGDTVTLSVGSGVLWLGGRGETQAGLVSVTTAEEPAAGSELTANSRYLNGGEGAVTVTVLSDGAKLAVEGSWLLVESDEEATHFYDLTQPKDWFYPGVRFTIDRGLFLGTSATEFSPLMVMSRSMLALILYRMEGAPEVEYSGTFADVAQGTWYTDGVEWAAAAGVVNGMGNGNFAPNDSLTREQIAVMLYRYAGKYLGLDVSAQGDLSGFADGASVSSWAESGMSWAVGAGILSGTGEGKLLPGNDATRAEVATMLQRFVLWMEAQA